jgi:putative aminopeptidase FrvX
MLAVDMAAIGETKLRMNSTRFASRDSAVVITTPSRVAGRQHEIPHKVDIYPTADGTALWRSGADMAVALIGGRDASPGYERTHTDALIATTRWVLAYCWANKMPAHA